MLSFSGHIIKPQVDKREGENDSNYQTWDVGLMQRQSIP